MNPGSLFRVSQGQPFKPSAGFHNTMAGTAEQVQRLTRGTTGNVLGEFQQTGICLVRNESGAARARFDVLGIDDILITPTNNLTRFQETPAFRGITPAEADHFGKFCVLLEPVNENKIARAVFAGVTVARVTVNEGEETREYADVKDGDAGSLAVFPAGGARILWREEGTGLVWALVRIGNAQTNLIRRCCLAEDHPGCGTPFKIKLGTWDPATNAWEYDTTEEDALSLDPEYEWQTYGIDWFYGVGFTYPLAGATGNFEAKPSDTYGTIWHVLGNMSCDADDCGQCGEGA